MAARGRKKSEEARQVCFSKRRKALFNKANELAVLCGAEVAAVAFSPGGKPFSYGYPSVKSVLDRFNPSESASAAVGGGAGDLNQALEELNREDGELRALLDAEKARKKAGKKALAKARAEGIQASMWLEPDVSQMGEEDLLAYSAALAKVEDSVAALADQVLQETMHQQQIMMAMPPPPGFATVSPSEEKI